MPSELLQRVLFLADATRSAAKRQLSRLMTLIYFHGTETGTTPLLASQQEVGTYSLSPFKNNNIPGL